MASAAWRATGSNNSIKILSPFALTQNKAYHITHDSWAYGGATLRDAGKQL